MSKENIIEITNKINKIILENNLEKIIEMTYSYEKISDKFFYNTTLFTSYVNISLDLNNDINYLLIKQKVEEKLNKNIYDILELISKLKDDALDEKGTILYKSLIYIKKILKVALLGLEFELEKAGYMSDLTILEKQKKVEEIEEIEELNFGLKVKNNLSEIKLIHDFLFSLYVDTKSKISDSEQLFFLSYINKLNIFLDKKDLEAKIIKKQKSKYKFWDNIISRENYIEIFNFILENIYELPQKTIITNASSIYDGEKFLEIPDKDTHKELTYKRVLGLVVHEIESHYINSYNNKILLGEFRGARNLEKEEGLAKTMEAFLYGEDEFHATYVPTYMAKILFSELYDGKDFYRFIEIYNKMHTLRRHPINEFLRQKRNYSLELKGGQHKDISYGRGMIKALNYLKKGGDFSVLFMGKVGFEDLEKINYLSKNNKNELLFPLFLGDIIALHLRNKEKGINTDLNLVLLVDYIEKKYHFKGIEKFNVKKNIQKKLKKIKELLLLIDNLENNI